MGTITGLGRYLFAIPLAIFGINHLMNAGGMAGMVPIPGGSIWIYLSGIGMIAAAVSIFTGKMDKLAMVLVAAMMLVFICCIHLRGAMSGDMMSTIGTLKDLMIAGGALMYAHTMARDNSIIG
jgi:putative oxidoreductase